MNKWVKDNLWGLLTLTGIIAGVIWFTKADLRMFTDAEKRMETEKFIDNADLNKVYGEYILDSIEEVQTRAWRKSQEEKNNALDKKLHKIDSLLRLNVYLSNQGVKKTDTLNKNITHTLEHVDQ